MDADTLQYLNIAKEVEITHTEQKQLIKNLNNQIYLLENQSPGLTPNKPSEVKDTSSIVNGAKKGALYGLALYLILAILVSIFQLGLVGSIVGFILTRAFGFITFPLVGAILGAKSASDSQVAAYNVAFATYNTALANYNKDIQAKEYQIRILQHEKAVIAKKERETAALLNRIYGAGILHKDYCSLPAICSILDYFQKGICDSFTGPDGAYARYDNEAQFNKVFTSLDNINESLNNIQSNQRSLYGAVKNVESEVAKVNTSINDFAETSAQKLSSINENLTDLNLKADEANNTLHGILDNTSAILWSVEIGNQQRDYMIWLANHGY